MSEISFLQTPLVAMVRDSPIIVIARLARPEPEMREFDTNFTNASGEIESFDFRVRVWHFEVLEVLKAEEAAPSGEIEVVAATLSKYYLSARQYRQSGTAMRMSFASNMTDYLHDVSELGERDAVLFLRPPMEPEYYSHQSNFKAYGQAYPLAATPGLDDPERKDEILEFLR